ncbi:MAG TPA: VOC family protein, partial [Spirochaetia bacterium]|nr:VOC family protein [Spirochaetia bacterium]
MKHIVVLCLALTSTPVVFSQSVAVDSLLMISVAVRDMDTSKAYYAAALGMKVTQDFSQGGQRWVSLGLPGGGASITLLQAADTE